MIQDKSTRFTLVATGILLTALLIIGWLLSRTAAARRGASQAGSAPPPGEMQAQNPTVPAGTGAGAAGEERTTPPPTLPLTAEGRPLAEYQVITDAALLEDPANDGDTFLLKTPQGAHRFCLYFVDTVETDGGQPEDARQLAEYFEFDSEEPLRALGIEARDFSLRLLKTTAFRVVTRWERNPAEDASYAFIYLKDPEHGLINLAQSLVRYGLARIVPCEQDQPDGATAAEFRELLVSEEALSREESHGAWSRKAP